MRLRIVLRLLLIQALWNHRTMLGPGMAWALLPALRERAEGGGERLEEGLHRESTHFNSHPYLASVAAGALARLEVDGVSAETIRRFRELLRGPLGSLGDALIWNSWLPACLLGASVAGLVGVPPMIAVGGFLLVYNSLHVAVRWWGVGVGLASGVEVGEALRKRALPRRAERVGRVGVLFLGLLAGILLGGMFLPNAMAPSPGPEVAGWAPLATGGALAAGAGLFCLGFVKGRGAWWWTAVLLPGAVSLILGAGLAGAAG